MTIKHRSSGVLLHISSLPSNFGIGDLGPESYRFVDLLADYKQNVWSILPLNPTSRKMGNSPYMSDSAFAGNPLLVSPDKLVKDKYLMKPSRISSDNAPANRVNYREIQTLKGKMLLDTYRKFKDDNLVKEESFEAFCSEMKGWLEDYTFFKALRQSSGAPWYLWPSALRNRETNPMTAKAESLKEPIEQEKVVQFLFFSQWQSLQEYCKRKNVRIMGDMPFYVSLDSADVWSHPEIFKLNKHKKPMYVAGVPPDYFSKTGQLWGTPVYDWKQLKEGNFDWWVQRIRHNLKMFDFIRFDHFRGFVSYWQVPASAKTAKAGRWIRSPTQSFFETLQRQFPSLPFVAEDLGVITQPVKDVIERLSLPGMRVLLFAFDGAQDNPHLPANHVKNSIVYTSTHDTNTVRGWFVDEASAEVKQRVFDCIGKRVSEEEISKKFIELAVTSKANLCIFPMQDLLGLGSEARMNHPAKPLGNWEWRVTKSQLKNGGMDWLRS